MKSLKKQISGFMVENSIIKDDDSEIISYGIDLFISSLVELISIFVISIFVGNLKETLFFFISFIPLRIYAGGYHANTKIRCYIVSLVVYGMFTLLMKMVPESYYVHVLSLASFLSFVIICSYAPIVHNNKSVNIQERKTYRKFSIVVFAIESLVIFVLCLLKAGRIYAISLSMGQMAEACAVVISVIKKAFLRK